MLDFIFNCASVFQGCYGSSSGKTKKEFETLLAPFIEKEHSFVLIMDYSGEYCKVIYTKNWHRIKTKLLECISHPIYRGDTVIGCLLLGTKKIIASDESLELLLGHLADLI